MIELFLINICSHEASHGNQKNRCESGAQTSRAEKTLTNEYIYADIYATVLAVEKVAQGKMKSQYDLDKINEGINEKLGWLKYYYGVTEYADLKPDVKKRVEEKTDEFVDVIKNGGAVSQGRTFTGEETILGYFEDAIDEAGVMADSFIGLLSVLSTKENTQYTEDIIKQLSEGLYGGRMSKNGQKMLNSIRQEDLPKMFELKDNKTEYTDDAIKIQQKLGREIFKDICSTIFADHMHNKFMKKDEYLPKLEDPINAPKSYEMIVADYEPRCFGTPNEFLKGAFPKGVLTKESEEQLLPLLKEVEAQYKARESKYNEARQKAELKATMQAQAKEDKVQKRVNSLREKLKNNKPKTQATRGATQKTTSPYDKHSKRDGGIDL